ncbi:class I SAM-dependent methyltransferase [Malikia spinosa]|uniref:Class I SAM-dependent methyltransferase n=1 Tax=Malikia spinosa TaxID=86180 RepID=A0A7C9J7M6_9BURK|nr:SAM-dependent methyltransferase [Malikia spinosa]MYZ51830.1 class I SAM-dependent methyltransferase [Malikia spinosa]
MSSDLSEKLKAHIVRELEISGGWLSFDRFMALALYQPGLGYYANDSVKFGSMPGSGSDFVTAPELSPWFGRTLGRQVAQALAATGCLEVWEFGAGSGALAQQILPQLDAMGHREVRYRIVDLSGTLRARQQQTLAAFGGRVEWIDRLPQRFEGVIVGNEVLDAMPVQLLQRRGGTWFERGVALAPPGQPSADSPAFVWEDRPTALRPPCEIEGPHDYLTEIHPQAEAFVRTLAERWTRGAAFFIDYGFPESEYYHPQRHMGTLICHRSHKTDHDPLTEVGLKDITAHVNFTGVALAAQDAGLPVLGYTSQGRFLINAGLIELAGEVPVAQRANLAKLVNEHEMGELFKVLAFAPAASAEGWIPLGFTAGDRSHTL